MIERVNSKNSPSFLFLNYEKISFNVQNVFAIPQYFFTPDIIEKRKPLSSSARRAGWVGCNILFEAIPESGRVYLIKNYEIRPVEAVVRQWKDTSFLGGVASTEKRWLLGVMNILEKMGKQYFSLDDVYQYEDELKIKYPNNNNIKAKIRQQLQRLRDGGYVQFIARGQYALLS